MAQAVQQLLAEATNPQTQTSARMRHLGLAGMHQAMLGELASAEGLLRGLNGQQRKK